MTGESLSSVNLEEQRMAKLERQIGEFAGKKKYCSHLSPSLKKIAADVAIETIMLNEKDLPMRAGELDALAIESSFARFEKEANGSLLNLYKNLRGHLVETGKSPEEIDRIANNGLRSAIASRLSRIRLAEELRCRQGQWIEIVTREDFKAANDLALQATREFV